MVLSVARAEEQLLLFDIVLSRFSGIELWLMSVNSRICNDAVDSWTRIATEEHIRRVGERFGLDKC